MPRKSSIKSVPAANGCPVRASAWADGRRMTAVTKRARFLLAVLIVITGVGCDQATKQIAAQQLRGTLPISFMHDLVRLQYAENQGAFLGLGNSLAPELRFWLLTVATAVLLLGLAIFLIVQWQLPRLSFIALSCVLAGGLGNMIDRLVHDGSVIDFLNLGLGSLRTGIFNIADVAITGGVVLLWAASFRATPQSDEPTRL